MGMEAKATPTAFTAFMAGLIDYAGLFPPARLPLPEALRHYGRYRQEAGAWMLGRFIIPAAKLAEADAWLPRPPVASAEPPWYFAILGRGGATAAEFEAGMATDQAAMVDFRRQRGESVSLAAFEVRLPQTLLTRAEPDLTALQETLAVAAGMLAATEQPVALYFEPPLPPSTPPAAWQKGIAAVVHAIANHNETLAGAAHIALAGLKLRCGGVTAADFPDVTQVAFALAACRDAAVPLKATAGLHQPLRHYDESVQATMHGFLNLFGAGILAHTHHLDHATIAAIVADENPAHFRFDAHAFVWQTAAHHQVVGHHLVATAPEIREARQKAVLSYGSCSFDEPRQHLRALGLML
jgi:hypothetical protein